MGIRHGIWKLVADRATGEILGTSIVGPRADDLVLVWVHAIRFVVAVIVKVIDAGRLIA